MPERLKAELNAKLEELRRKNNLRSLEIINWIEGLLKKAESEEPEAPKEPEEIEVELPKEEEKKEVKKPGKTQKIVFKKK